MDMAKFNIKESYINAWWQSVKDKPYAISEAVSLAILFLAVANLYFKWIKDNTMNIILLIVPVASFLLIALFFVPYAIWKKQKQTTSILEQENIRIKSILNNFQITDTLREDRMRMRNKEIANIPNTIEKMYLCLMSLAKDNTDKINITDKREVLRDILKEYQIDVNLEKLQSMGQNRADKKTRKILRQLLRNANIKSVWDENFVKLILNIEASLKKHNIEISQLANQDKDYLELHNTFIKYKQDIFTHSLQKSITRYNQYAQGFSNNYLIFPVPEIASPAIHRMIPQEYQLVFYLTPKGIEEVMSILLMDVKIHLENYLLGLSDDSK